MDLSEVESSRSVEDIEKNADDPFPALKGEGSLGSWGLPAFNAGY
jgi:hypothetical protein